MTYGSRICPKQLFSCIKRGTKNSDGIPPILLHENSDIPDESDLTKAETLTNYFGEDYSMGIVNNTYHNDSTKTPVIGPVNVTGKAVVQLYI
ncbi:unnamed protein product [Schistosoma curassoni]|uniref:Peptidase_M4_C domain-containing protein n=1 Tax=Schistosoma curassoni TaxID=6186 RepID=A0A183KGX2_9TREM|nr:unnamed protein product [Schistosoma curassoni]